MKKRIFIMIASAAMLFATIETQAQRANLPVTAALSATYSKVTDTLTSTAAHYMVSSILPATMKITAVATCTELTLVTAGTLTIEGSLDGTNWHALRLPGTTTALETFTVTDVASQSFSWDLQYFADRYFRVKAVGNASGTWTIAVKYSGVARQ